jgi:hypothetical protein
MGRSKNGIKFGSETDRKGPIEVPESKWQCNSKPGAKRKVIPLFWMDSTGSGKSPVTGESCENGIKIWFNKDGETSSQRELRILRKGCAAVRMGS